MLLLTILLLLLYSNPMMASGHKILNLNLKTLQQIIVAVAAIF